MKYNLAASFQNTINKILYKKTKVAAQMFRDKTKEENFELDRLSKMALNDPSTGGNPKKLTENDMKILYQHSMSGELFK